MLSNEAYSLKMESSLTRSKGMSIHSESQKLLSPEVLPLQGALTLT